MSVLALMAQLNRCSTMPPVSNYEHGGAHSMTFRTVPFAIAAASAIVRRNSTPGACGAASNRSGVVSALSHHRRMSVMSGPCVARRCHAQVREPADYANEIERAAALCSHMDAGRPQMQATAVQMCRRIAAGACVAATV
jgi:hypothetical protein